MGNVWFFLKTAFLTFVLVTLLQIRWGTKTLETHATQWFVGSSLVQPLQEVADGAGKLVRNTWDGISHSLKGKLWHARDGARERLRSLNLGLERSPAAVSKERRTSKSESDRTAGRTDNSP